MVVRGKVIAFRGEEIETVWTCGKDGERRENVVMAGGGQKKKRETC